MEQLIFILEVLGTIAFAASSAIIGIKRGSDFFGVIFLGLTAAVGGGILRDVLIGNIPPNAFRNEIYILIATLTSVLVFILVALFHGRFDSLHLYFDWLINSFDAVGLGIFTINGMNVAFAHHEEPFLIVFVGMITGVGGGILRDVMLNDIPFVLRKHIYAVAALLGGIAYYLLLTYHVPQQFSLFFCVFLIFAIRMLATKYKWNLPRIRL